MGGLARHNRCCAAVVVLPMRPLAGRPRRWSDDVFPRLGESVVVPRYEFVRGGFRDGSSDSSGPEHSGLRRESMRAAISLQQGSILTPYPRDSPLPRRRPSDPPTGVPPREAASPGSRRRHQECRRRPEVAEKFTMPSADRVCPSVINAYRAGRAGRASHSHPRGRPSRPKLTRRRDLPVIGHECEAVAVTVGSRGIARIRAIRAVCPTPNRTSSAACGGVRCWWPAHDSDSARRGGDLPSDVHPPWKRDAAPLGTVGGWTAGEGRTACSPWRSRGRCRASADKCCGTVISGTRAPVRQRGHRRRG